MRHVHHVHHVIRRARGSALEGLQRWIDGLPAWLRPPVYGALFVLLLMGLRGLVIVFPIVLIALLWSRTPLTDLGMILGVLGLALFGGFLAGLSYSLVGRWLRPIPVMGPYLAGIITVLPYMLAVLVIVHIMDQTPLQWPPDGGDVFTFDSTLSSASSYWRCCSVGSGRGSRRLRCVEA